MNLDFNNELGLFPYEFPCDCDRRRNVANQQFCEPKFSFYCEEKNNLDHCLNVKGQATES